MKTFLFKVASPDGVRSWHNAVSVGVPAAGGRLTVLAGHELFVCSVKAGSIRIATDGGELMELRTGAGTMSVAALSTTLVVDTVFE